MERLIAERAKEQNSLTKNQEKNAMWASDGLLRGRLGGLSERLEGLLGRLEATFGVLE